MKRLCPMIVAICGVKRSGKDAIAGRILQSDQKFSHVKISESLKKMCRLLFNFTEEEVEGPEKDYIAATWGITPRKAMQFIGTEVMQYKIQEILPDVGRCFWIKKILTDPTLSTKPIVISDLRFKHEEQALRHSGRRVVIIKVTRPAHTPESEEEGEEDLHPSEQEWKEVREDVWIRNEGTLLDLYEQVDRLLVEINRSDTVEPIHVLHK